MIYDIEKNIINKIFNGFYVKNIYLLISPKTGLLNNYLFI